MVDKPVSWFLCFRGAGFLFLGQWGLAFSPVWFLVVAGCVDVVLGDDFAGARAREADVPMGALKVRYTHVYRRENG